MPAALTDQQAFYLARVSTLTGLSTSELQDFLCATPEQQALIAQGYQEMSWTKDEDVFSEVVSVLGVLATIAGDLTGVGSAITLLRGF